jgi:methenyltetrahydrofolate cyclohydrolase
MGGHAIGNETVHKPASQHKKAADETTLEDFLAALASAAPAPGGGAAAALQAALGAALVSMVCNLTIGKARYAEHEPTMRRVLAEADAARGRALTLAAADADAFAAVSAAYRLPRDSDADRADRGRAIQRALIHATDVPLRTAALAAAIVHLCADILDGANVNVLSDVGVAAASARAALESAALNVHVNLAGLTDAGTRTALAAQLDAHVTAADAATDIVHAARNRILS